MIQSKSSETCQNLDFLQRGARLLISLSSRCSSFASVSPRCVMLGLILGRTMPPIDVNSIAGYLILGPSSLNFGARVWYRC